MPAFHTSSFSLFYFLLCLTHNLKKVPFLCYQTTAFKSLFYVTVDINLSQILSVFATLKVNQNAMTDLKNFSSKPKDLELLDGMALLAVTEGSHDVAAVTMNSHAEAQVGRTILKFHMINNRIFSIDEIKYLNNLCDLLNSCVRNRLLISLQELIIPKCRQKIIARLVKLQKKKRSKTFKN